MIAYDGHKILTFYNSAKESLEKGICAPRTALVYPSRSCNQNCYFCSDNDTNKDLGFRVMKKSLLLSIPRQVKEIGCEAIEMCGGGEPFLSNYIPEFIEECMKYDLKLGSLTNGTRLKGELADLVVDTFSFIRISVDSFNPTTYSKIRQTPLSGGNSLEQVIANIKYLVKRKRETGSKILITVKAVFNKETLFELPSYIDYATSLGVSGINIKGVRNVGDQLDVSAIPQIYIDYLTQKKKANVEGKPWVFGTLFNSTIHTPICFACNFHVFIDTDGSLRICCYYQNRPIEHTFGILTETNLKELWESEIHKQKVKEIDTTKCNVYNCKYHTFNNILYKGIVEDEGQWQFT